MIGQSKINERNERIPDMTQKGMLLDFNVSLNKKIKKIQQTSNFKKIAEAFILYDHKSSTL